MAKAILRVMKMKGAGSISGKTAHNYRLREVSNADVERQYLNKEYIPGPENLGERIHQRIQEAGVTRLRKDAVMGMEFVMTASPEIFKRDEAGTCSHDMRETKWVYEQLRFLQAEYGKENVVSFVLHQDEKTPHIHAVIVPLTKDNRLCAKELFNPQTLSELQTSYANAVSNSYSDNVILERGIKGSRRPNIPMKEYYAHQAQTQEQLQHTLQPLQQPPAPLELAKPGGLDLLALDAWRQQEQARLNEQLQQEVARIQAAAQDAIRAAVANAGAKDKAQDQEKSLAAALRSLDKKTGLERQATQQLTEEKTLSRQIITLAELGQLDPNWVKQHAEYNRHVVRAEVSADLDKVSKLPIQTEKQFAEEIKKLGYTFGAATGKKATHLVHSSGIAFDLEEKKFSGKSVRDISAAIIEQTKETALKKQVLPPLPTAGPKTAQIWEAGWGFEGQKPGILRIGIGVQHDNILIFNMLQRRK